MKVKLIDIVSARESINRLIKSNLPAKKSYLISKMFKPVIEEINTFEKKRNDLVLKYGEQMGEDKAQYAVKQENMKQYTDEVKDLLDIDLEYDVEPINLEDLLNDDVKLTAEDFVLLDKFIKE